MVELKDTLDKLDFAERILTLNSLRVLTLIQISNGTWFLSDHEKIWKSLQLNNIQTNTSTKS